MPPLPHFGANWPIGGFNSIAQGRYEFDIVDVDNDSFLYHMWPERMKFVTRNKKDRIKLSYIVKVDNLQKSPISTLFGNVFLGLLHIHDDNGSVIHKELLNLEFHSSEMELDGDEYLTFDVVFKILESELVSEDYKLDRPKLIRNYKLERLI